MSLDKLTDQHALIPMMGILMKEIRAILISEFKLHGVNLTKEQLIVLKKLMENDGRPQTDLALVTSRDKTSLTRLLTTMENKKLIRRKQSKQDKRINRVYITQKGKREIDKASPIVLNMFNQALKGIEIDKIEKTKSVLREVYKNLNIKNEE